MIGESITTNNVVLKSKETYSNPYPVHAIASWKPAIPRDIRLVTLKESVTNDIIDTLSWEEFIRLYEIE